jgi:DNA-dependent protein kinase catalytic subunit
VGDRHLQNILLDVNTGSVVHIDFGYAFGTATSVLPIPELVPFRLTKALLDGLAPNDGTDFFEGGHGRSDARGENRRRAA